MALTVKHLNDDASFLLTFEPIFPSSPPGVEGKPFRVLIDPWITGPSTIFHSKLSITTHKTPPCVSSLNELPEPDIIIISQHKSDHCNEATLRQLPATGTKTIILAEPASAKLIRSWKYFGKDKVRTIPKWEDPRLTGRHAFVRISVPPVQPGGDPGEVTVAFIPQRRDVSGLHGAIGITYRQPSIAVLPAAADKGLSYVHSSTPSSDRTGTADQPATPRSHKSYGHLPRLSGNTAPDANYALMPPTPTSPGISLRSVRSASSLPASVSSRLTGLSSATTLTARTAASLSPRAFERPLSVIFSPHGISYSSLEPYATSHLVAETALPLTALLHCFDSVSNPWWLGGNVLLGAPAGAQTAQRLCARAWISAHDGDKNVRGFATGLLKTRKWRVDEVEGAITAGATDLDPAPLPRGRPIAARPRDSHATEVLSLASGEDVVITSEGIVQFDPSEEIGYPVGLPVSVPPVPALPSQHDDRKHAGLMATVAEVIMAN